MKAQKEFPVLKETDGNRRMEVTYDYDLEEALEIAGNGKYQVFHVALMCLTLAAALQEMIGYQFILPAAACDLEMPEGLRGVITSIPNIGIILTAPFWGQITDAKGRKTVLLLTSAAAGIASVLAAFMPNLIGFVICKFIGSLFLSCPTSLSFAYAGEMTPYSRRDFAVLICNGFLTLSAVLNPIFAWAVLTVDWEFQLGSLTMRPWRLLAIVYALPMVLVALWLTQARESPKFLMAKDRKEETLEVLRHIYARNKGKSPDSYCVTSLKSEENVKEATQNGSEEHLAPKVNNESAFALIRPPYLKWFALISVLMFGLYSVLNGLFLFATDTLNKVLREPSEESGTVCVLINQSDNQTSTETCNDAISQDTFLIMIVSTLAVVVVVFLGSISPLSKKTLLVSMYVVTAIATLLSGLLTNRVVAGVLMSAMQITALGIGALTAYAVQLFPTTLRGTAVGAVLMFGRVGSVTGANVAGRLLSVACTATFYGFAALLALCAALSFLLPNTKKISPRQQSVDVTNNDKIIISTVKDLIYFAFDMLV